MERLRIKTKKFAQLAQKLYNLDWIEKRLISRKQMEAEMLKR